VVEEDVSAIFGSTLWDRNPDNLENAQKAIFWLFDPNLWARHSQSTENAYISLCSLYVLA
jgi:hypothetical protein